MPCISMGSETPVLPVNGSYPSSLRLIRQPEKPGKIPSFLGVSHLLHMAFFPGLYDSRGQLCLVNPTMQSRTCLQLAVLPHWAESRSCAWQVCKVACLSSHRAAILSVTYPGVPAVTEQICAAAHICSYAESMNMRSV